MLLTTWREAPDVLFLQETILQAIRVIQVKFPLGFIGGMGVDYERRSGGMTMF